MPRTCLACSNPDRAAIDQAIATGEPLRNIAKRVSISPAGLLRHKAHVSVALAKIADKREESIGESVMARLEKLYQRAEKVLNAAEASGDGRLALASIREVRETLGGLFALVSKSTRSDESQEEILRELTLQIVEANKRRAKWPSCPTCHQKVTPGQGIEQGGGSKALPQAR